MSIISLHGLERSVIIIPEMAINAGWNEIAFKIERFIQYVNHSLLTEQLRPIKKDLSYAHVAGESKWHSDVLSDLTVTSSKADFNFTVSPGTKDTGLFKRCIVASFLE